ncbi:unnamed protein product [Mytilus edulis]|uniref:ATP-dependent DNA helicase n=1 Tax=Mytilus edulis TaxID=6550 RepID=A0A8S3UHT9_MYTED|nr:unnamed protein product [Mytilus edulis]
MYDRATSQSKSFTNDESENEQDPSLPETDVYQELPKTITLQDTDAIMKKRTNPVVPRWHVVSERGAGTGKSRLIKTIYYQVSRTLQTSGQDPDHPCIKLTAPTGCAAFNIGGSTIHSALKLPVKGGYYSLRGNPSMLATFQSKYENLLILVIDEVSMLGRKAFAHVHKRLQEIKNVEGTDKIFEVSVYLPLVICSKFHQYENVEYMTPLLITI